MFWVAANYGGGTKDSNIAYLDRGGVFYQDSSIYRRTAGAARLSVYSYFQAIRRAGKKKCRYKMVYVLRSKGNLVFINTSIMRISGVGPPARQYRY